ncbi:unnamed protein product [Phytophthora lilii]|uniref:Unnamed protein product n=1 Tax=Phytophthora lilii TaxID=2077276 RepID=A0A9W6XAC2_9STRA|nr:unnamed protein product [Phytophthora lilii]
MDELLSKLYHDPKTGYVGANALYQKAKKINKSIRLKDVKEWYANQTDIQRYNAKAAEFDDFKITSTNPNSWQADLAFLKGNVILTAININSRVGFAKIIADKRWSSVSKGIKSLELLKVDILTTDNGSEFMNRHAQAYFKRKSITHYNNEPGDHGTMGKIERFNRTLKSRLMKIKQPLTNKLLSDVIDNYNNTMHTSIKMTPNEASGQIIESELSHNNKAMDNLENRLEIGESVLYRLKKKQFEKESARWSKAIYEVVGIDGYRVQIRSKNGHTLYKSPNDIKLVNDTPTDAKLEKNQVFEAEKILDHKRTRTGKYKYLIKWVGHGDPTWEIQDNLQLVNKSKRSTLEVEYWKKKMRSVSFKI